MSSSRASSYLNLVGTYLIWSTYGLFVRYLPLDEQSILFFRFSFALIGILFIISYRNNLKEMFMLKGNWLVWLYSIFSVLSWFAFTKALKYTSISHAVFLISTGPIFVIAFAPFILKEKLEFHSIAGLLLALLGITFIVGSDGLFLSGGSITGDLLALLSGILYAAYIITAKRLPPQLLGLNLVGYECFLGTLLFFQFGLNSVFSLNAVTVLTLIAFASLHVVIGSILYLKALRILKAQHVAILSYLEPLSATVLAIFLLGETLTIWTILGGILIIAAGLISIFSSKKSEA